MKTITVSQVAQALLTAAVVAYFVLLTLNAIL